MAISRRGAIIFRASPLACGSRVPVSHFCHYSRSFTSRAVRQILTVGDETEEISEMRPRRPCATICGYFATKGRCASSCVRVYARCRGLSTPYAAAVCVDHSGLRAVCRVRLLSKSGILSHALAGSGNSRLMQATSCLDLSPTSPVASRGVTSITTAIYRVGQISFCSACLKRGGLCARCRYCIGRCGASAAFCPVMRFSVTITEIRGTRRLEM